MQGEYGLSRKQSRFEIYLRTGRRIAEAEIELKFNPWHDRQDGRFTFVGGGGYFGRGGSGAGTTGLRRHSGDSLARATSQADQSFEFGVSADAGAGLRLPATNPPRKVPFHGGGGGFGGGGASGSYSLPGEAKPSRTSVSSPHGDAAAAAARAAKDRARAAEARDRARAHPKPIVHPKPKPSPSTRQIVPHTEGAIAAGAQGAAAHSAVNAAGTAAVASSIATAGAGTVEWQNVSRNGYNFGIDGIGRTREIAGNLTLNQTQARSRTAQRNAGSPDRLPSDEGGHYIARRFNGPTDDFNHFAQNANFNRGKYAKLENLWASELRAGRKVWVDIRPSYPHGSRRPSLIRVTYRIQDGRRHQIYFPNIGQYRR